MEQIDSGDAQFIACFYNGTFGKMELPLIDPNEVLPRRTLVRDEDTARVREHHLSG